MTKQKKIAAAVLVLICAGNAHGETPLPPGKPAGVKPAIELDPKGTVAVGLAIVVLAAGIYFLKSNYKDPQTAATSTSP